MRGILDTDGVAEKITGREPEIFWTFTPSIKTGEYPAYCRTAKVYRDGQFKRWVCAVQFDVLDSSLIHVLARLTWYLNLGSRDKPTPAGAGTLLVGQFRCTPSSPESATMLSQVFSRSTAIFRNAFGYRPIARFFATRSSFPCKVCQLRVFHFRVQSRRKPGGTNQHQKCR